MQQHIYLISGLKKMKSISFLLVLLFTATFSFAQTYETNPNFLRTKNWYFGNGIGLSFEKDSITLKNGYQGFNYEGTAILNDTNGNLRFYSDGKYLYDSNHQIVNTTFQFKGDNSSCQGVILTVFPERESYINIFTTTPTFSAIRSGFRYSLYDQVLDSFIIRNKTLVKDIGEKQASIFHQNNRSTWISCHSLLNDTFYSFLLTDTQINCCPVTTKIGEKYEDRFPSQGTLKFSADGNLAINAHWNLENFELLSFSNEIGYFSNNKIVPLFYPYSTEFSTDGLNILVIDRGESIFHFRTLDIKSGILSPFDTIVQHYPNELFGQVQLSINGELYISIYEDSLMSKLIVNDSIIFVDSAVSLNGKKSLGGLPNFNASYFYTPSVDYAYTEDCWEHTYSFEGRDTFDADGYKWVFEKGAYRDSILTKHCNYTFADTGKWQVSHIAWNASRADTVSKTLTIRPKWKNNLLGKDTFYCLPFDSGQGDSSARADFTLTLKAPADMHCVHWNGEEPNLDDALGPIVDYDHFHTDTLQVDTAGKYIVKLTNKTFCQMYDTITVTEIPNPQKPSIQRNGQELESSITAAEYRWYFNGNLTLTTINSQLIPDSNGYWQVQLISEYGCESQLSDSFNVGFASLKPLNPKPLSFKIYPNPSDGHISIEVPKEGQYNLTLSTIGGQLVRLSDSPQGELYRSVNKRIEFELNLANGTYILTLTDEDGKTGSKKIEVVN